MCPSCSLVPRIKAAANSVVVSAADLIWPACLLLNNLQHSNSDGLCDSSAHTPAVDLTLLLSQQLFDMSDAHNDEQLEEFWQAVLELGYGHLSSCQDEVLALTQQHQKRMKASDKPAQRKKLRYQLDKDLACTAGVVWGVQSFKVQNTRLHVLVKEMIPDA